jgi:RecA-family ATPase
MPASINLIKERRLLITEIKAQLAARSITDPPIGVVLDTLNRSLTGSESSDEDMGNYIKAADELREQFDCLVPIVHHCGHDETRPRGHSSPPSTAKSRSTGPSAASA